MCIALSLAEKPVDWVHMQSSRFKGGTPIFPRPIYILDESEGAELAKTLGNASAHDDQGHGIVTVGETIDEACINALYMERTAKIMAIAAPARLSRADPGIDSNSDRQPRKSFFAGRATKCFTRPSGTTTPTRSKRRALDARLDVKSFQQGARNDTANFAVAIYFPALSVFRPRPRNPSGRLRRLRRLSSAGLGAQRSRLVHQIWL